MVAKKNKEKMRQSEGREKMGKEINQRMRNFVDFIALGES